MKLALSLPALLLATTALAEDTRHMDAHVHGVGTLNIAFDGNMIAMELEAPGSDIVGFEYEAERAEDLAAIEAAEEALSDPLSLFILPAAAGCTVTEVEAHLEGEEHHDDHDEDHDDHDEDHHEGEAHHDEHEEEHDKHHDEHAEHEDHHDEGEHADDDHGDHGDEESHSEFHAEYLLTCEDVQAATSISFAYFQTFENALELEIQVISAKGAQAFEVERDAPELDLSGAL